MIVHGIPGPYALADGDILSVDVGVTLDGFIGDAAYTFAVGEISPEAARLLATCQEALVAGIEQCRAGQPALRRLARGAGGDRVGRLHGRARARRPRRRPRDARGPADPELRPARPRPRAAARHGLRDRADDHRRHVPDLPARRRLVDLDRRRVARRPTSSTPWRSPRASPRILTWPHPSVAAPLVRHAGANS